MGIMDKDGISVENPFPLARIFRTRILPAVVLILAVMAVVGVIVEVRITEKIFLNLAQSRAETVVRQVKAAEPEAWTMMERDPLSLFSDHDRLTRLDDAFALAVKSSNIARIKVYEPGGRVVAGGAMLGALETSDGLREALISGIPNLIRKTDDHGGAVYEFYIPHKNEVGATVALLEIYEDVGYLDHLLLSNATPAIALPVVLLSLLLVWLGFVIRRAQADIDARTLALLGMRTRLESFLSGSAKGAARLLPDGSVPESRTIDVTLFHSDVVDFTGFSETCQPQKVVDFLNRLMGIQVEILHRHQGDVDKMIGDAVLATFEGPDRAERAIQASIAIQEALAAEIDLPRPIRIGLHDGYVISGAIGPPERRDFTVIGDSVNVSARLCSLAQPGEVVADQGTLARAGHPAGFADPEEVTVKGRQQRIEIRRWRRPLAATPSLEAPKGRIRSASARVAVIKPSRNSP